MKITELDAISNLQRRAVRIIAGVPYQSSSEPLFKSMKILNVKKVYISKVAMFMYNVDKGNYPGCITDMYSTNSLYHEYYTRQHDSLHVPICRNDYMKRNIRYVGVVIWNRLKKLGFHSQCSYHGFKKKLNSYLLDNDIDL